MHGTMQVVHAAGFRLEVGFEENVTHCDRAGAVIRAARSRVGKGLHKVECRAASVASLLRRVQLRAAPMRISIMPYRVMRKHIIGGEKRCFIREIEPR